MFIKSCKNNNNNSTNNDKYYERDNNNNNNKHIWLSLVTSEKRSIVIWSIFLIP